MLSARFPAPVATTPLNVDLMDPSAWSDSFLSASCRVSVPIVEVPTTEARAIAMPNPLPVVVMGDLNDGPGLDPCERMVGRSFVETLMGSVFEPHSSFHNTLWWMSKKSTTRKDLWTADFPDPIVTHPKGWEHRVWIDHILASPDMLEPTNSVRYVIDSGRVAPKNRNSREASDHFAVYCGIETT